MTRRDFFCLAQVSIIFLCCGCSINKSSTEIRTDEQMLEVSFENDRTKGLLAKNVTSAKIYYEASVEHPGYLDRVNSITKKRQTGSFEHGEFKAL